MVIDTVLPHDSIHSPFSIIHCLLLSPHCRSISYHHNLVETFYHYCYYIYIYILLVTNFFAFYILSSYFTMVINSIIIVILLNFIFR